MGPVLHLNVMQRIDDQRLRDRGAKSGKEQEAWFNSIVRLYGRWLWL